MPGEFAGKVAVITGGSRGIGREIAVDFARQGAQTVIVSSSALRTAIPFDSRIASASASRASYALSRTTTMSLMMASTAVAPGIE